MSKTATIYRMVTPDHLCPWGLKAKAQLEQAGYEIDDHHLETMEANEAYKREHNVDETPQIFIEGKHIGGYDAMREHLGKGKEGPTGTTYQPVIAIFATTFLLALTATYAGTGALPLIRVAELFVAFSMVVLGIMKLRDLHSFQIQFLGYDLIARRSPRYAFVYPFVETVAGALMVAGLATVVAAPAALFVSTVGAISVFKAVYIDKRELKCACVGGDSNVPLGFVSLTENLMMMAMSVWMLTKAL